jgi:hypothetical protein
LQRFARGDAGIALIVTASAALFEDRVAGFGGGLQQDGAQR